jgi:hypothetical protein
MPWRLMESAGIGPPFLVSVLDGSEQSASRHCRFAPGESPPFLLDGKLRES